MTTFITVIHVIVCVFLMLTVLLQSGKGGGMGAAFGGGNTGTVFGGSGASQFLRRLTVGAAVIFMVTSMLLAYLASQSSEDALRAFSASQRRQRELKEQLREEALEGTAPVAPDVPEDQGGAPEGDDSIDQPDVDPNAPTDQPPAGGETDKDGTGAVDDAKKPAEDAPKGEATKPADAPKTPPATPAGDTTKPTQPKPTAPTPAAPKPATP
jgi:preprotein translocase subunit SecG